MDQNTTTVLTTLITVGGTLGGVILGVVLSNRYVARQEKSKRYSAIIEEVYTLLTNINAQMSENIDHERPVIEGKPLQDDIRRLQVLIYLYFPSLKEKLDVLMRSMFRFSSKVNNEQKNNKPPQVWKNVSEAYKEYREKLMDIRAPLEKLVR